MQDDDKQINNEEEVIDDVSFDELDSDGESLLSNSKNTIQKLKAKIKKLEEEKNEYLLGWQKERADGVNLRKRFEEEKKDFVKYANKNLIEEFIPILDGFESAMKNKEVWEKVDQNWRVGIEYLSNQLFSILEQNGLQKLYPINEDFDIRRDEAIEMIKINEPDKNGKILEVIQSGYKINDTIIRPTKVKVREIDG